MELQAEAERRKRAQVPPAATRVYTSSSPWCTIALSSLPCHTCGTACRARTVRLPCVSCPQILESEGQRQSKINVAEAAKSEVGGHGLRWTGSVCCKPAVRCCRQVHLGCGR